jgi:hypothetical protein
MANKKGIALIMSLFIVIFLAVLMAPFFIKSTNEGSLVRRYVDSTRALWLAEAGLAEGVRHLPNNRSGFVDNPNHAYDAVTTHLNGSYYQVDSTGSVALPGGGAVSRKIRAIVKTMSVDPSKFKYAIETTGDLKIKGSVDITPVGSQKDFSTLDFADLFSFSKEQIEDFATRMNAPKNQDAVFHGVYWLYSDGQTITGNWTGDGILVIEGDVHFAGTIQFDGIIYVIGKLTLSGTADAYGSVLAESGALVDTIVHGDVSLAYDLAKIQAALQYLVFVAPQAVSWQEIAP